MLAENERAVDVIRRHVRDLESQECHWTRAFQENQKIGKVYDLVILGLRPRLSIVISMVASSPIASCSGFDKCNTGVIGHPQKNVQFLGKFIVYITLEILMLN